jgi:hypothetical protein
LDDSGRKVLGSLRTFFPDPGWSFSSIPIASIPIASIPIASIPIASIPIASIPIGATHLLNWCHPPI